MDLISGLLNADDKPSVLNMFLNVKYSRWKARVDENIELIAAGFWIMSLLIGLFGSMLLTSVILIYFFYTWTFFAFLAYLSWVFYFDIRTSSRGGRRIKWVRNWMVWKYFKSYFPIALVKDGDFRLDPTRNYLFASHPHGFICAGSFCTFMTEANGFATMFPGFVPYVATVLLNFIVPFVREYALALGSILSSERSLSYVLSDKNGGNVAVIIVGGIQESLYSYPGHYRLVLKNRKGFVRVALKNGTPIVPVFSFGEPDLFYSYPCDMDSWARKLQTFVKNKLLIPFCVIYGRGFGKDSLGMFPNKRPVTVVVGEPMDVPRIDNPSREVVDEYHGMYLERLERLFETNKRKYLTDADHVHLELF